MNKKSFLIGISVLSIVLRLMPHLHNFSSIIALSIISGVVYKKKEGIIFPLGALVLSDIIIGLHDVVLFTWASIVFIYFLSRIVEKPNLFKIGFLNFGCCLIYFLITNFGVWLVGWYPHTLKGLYECYLKAIPFFRISVFSNLIFSILFYLGCAFLFYKEISFSAKLSRR